MVSMLESIAATSRDRPTWYVHGTLNGHTHAMRDHVRGLVAGDEMLKVQTFYAQPDAQDRLGEHYDDAGLITPEWLVAQTPHAAATYYLCGPKPFLSALVNGLMRRGVPAERIRFEFFGPTDELLDEARQAA
jgi:nitric oxide dioxygenase